MRNFHRTLQFRLVAGFVIVLTMALVATGIVTVVMAYRAADNYAVDFENTQQNRVAELIAHAYISKDADKFSDALQFANRTLDWNIVIRLPGGEYFPYEPSPQLNNLLKSENTDVRKVVWHAKDDPIDIYGPYTIDAYGPHHGRHTMRVYVFDVANIAELTPADVSDAIFVETPAIAQVAHAFRNSLILAGALAAVLGVAAVLYLTRRSLRPLSMLSVATTKLGGGDLSQRIRERGAEEVRRLTRSFNRMAANLETAEQNRRRTTSDTAHELRTPLSNIKGYLEAIEDGVLKPDKRTIAKLSSQTSHLSGLVEDLYLIATANEGKLSLVKMESNLATAVERVVTDFTPRARERNIKLNFEAAREVRLKFDEQRIRQVVSNLVNNALRHTPEGGTVTVTVDTTAGGTKTRIVVNDTGEGIASEDLRHVFDEYYRVDQSRATTTGGSGLGLTIASKIMEAHGGAISVQSIVGQGSTFTVEL